MSLGLCRIASAAMAVESMPPDRNEPTVTSARICLATESESTSVISSYRDWRVARVNGATSNRAGK
ncbi:Uncharacterised protein [Mycobacteroides abscessus]|nr:Uncharacterised protein [Mycobacteroides abscessus]SIN59380.1 Uncharacterised protein [Mycobacteroides abscessus subsp. abscessus]